MPPRSQPLPEAATESAREARKSFFCELCQKGYARMNDFEAHENSYDHQHNKRLKEMRQMTRDPKAAARARQAEERANQEAGLRSITNSALLGSANQGAPEIGKKRKHGGFKSTLQPHNFVAVTGKPQPGQTITEVTKPHSEPHTQYQPVLMESIKHGSGVKFDDKGRKIDPTPWSGCEEELPSDQTPEGWARFAQRDDPRDSLSETMDIIFENGKFVLLPFEKNPN